MAAKHGLISGATMTVPQSEVAALSRDPNIAWVSPDRPVGAQGDCGIADLRRAEAKPFASARPTLCSFKLPGYSTIISF